MKLCMDHISFSYGDKLFRFHMEISTPITGIFGYSGAGKTTLLHLISGIETPLSGRIVFNGRTCFDSRQKINVHVNRRNIGVVFQDKCLFPHLTVRKNLEFGKKYAKQKHQKTGEDCVIELLDLGHLLKKKPYQLSGGEQQRVAIGRCLLSQPDLLLMDEPFSNLDGKRKDEIIVYLREITAKFDIPLLIISHDLEDILKLTRSLVIIENGSVKACGDYTGLCSHVTGRDLPLRNLAPEGSIILSRVG